MKQFMDENFLLDTETAQHLYHQYAAPLPLIDYHCHLDARLIAEEHQFKNMTELWLDCDHYKWRAMRTNGVHEQYCTGNQVTDWEKFEKWAETVPYTYRNPLFHWTQLELKRAFGIDTLLSPKTAKAIYEECNEKLALPEYSVRGLLRKFNVECLCTKADPVDSLESHLAIAKSDLRTKVFPTWNPTRAMNINKEGFADYMARLSEVSGVEVDCYASLLDALKKRHDYFASCGCKSSDHGMEQFYDEEYTDSQIETIFCKALRGLRLSDLEVRKYKHAFLRDCAIMDKEADWTQQYHFGILRDNNSMMYTLLGSETGFDSIGEFATAKVMGKFLNELHSGDNLTRTILYPLNPCASEVVASMVGCFQDGSIPGKLQFGAAWWFNDHLEGMTRQLNVLSSLGLLSRFVGMLSDSRTLLSYSRHEYFRRLLCNILGDEVERGLLPMDEENLSRMVRDICYDNARRYLKLY